MSAVVITSADNKLFKLWHSLLSAKGIDKQGLALVSGRKIVPELARTAGAGATLLLREGDLFPPPVTGEGDHEVVEGAIAAPPRGHLLRERGRKEEAQAMPRTALLAPVLFDTLDEFGTKAPLLVLPTPEVTQCDIAAPPRGLELLIAAQDPSNLGAILRSAFALGVSQAVLLQECANPFLPRVTRAATGANFQLRLAYGPQIRSLETGAIALDMSGIPIDAFAFPSDCRLLLGEEGAGVPDTFRGPRMAIPMAPKADSLNIAVAAGIALAAYRRQHPL